MIVGTLPYDAGFEGGGNRIGPNVTLGRWATFGLELFPVDWHALYVEGGGGLETYCGLRDEEDPVAVATAWLGSGATVKVGTRLHL